LSTNLTIHSTHCRKHLVVASTEMSILNRDG
jgi:hypothetical protein